MSDCTSVVYFCVASVYCLSSYFCSCLLLLVVVSIPITLFRAICVNHVKYKSIPNQLTNIFDLGHSRSQNKKLKAYSLFMQEGQNPLILLIE